MTINEALAVSKAVRERINDLERMRNQVITETRHYDVDGKLRQETTVKVDVKTLDGKITLLQNFLLKADAGIKAANATTPVPALEKVDVDSLLAPLA